MTESGALSDTHCHLNLRQFEDDLEQVLERARQRGVERILVPGIDVETSRKALALTERHPQLYAAVGIHPHDAASWKTDTLTVLRELAAHPKTVAIGEIGLDYKRDFAPRPVQRQVFRDQLQLAGETGLPVVIHNRDSFVDVWDDVSAWLKHLSESGHPLSERPGVFHSFDGSLEQARAVTASGFLIGISGPVTYKNAPERQQVAAGLRLQDVMIETDAPYLTPHPYRGRRNEPAYVAFIAEKLAELHSQSLAGILQATWENADRLFHWGAKH